MATKTHDHIGVSVSRAGTSLMGILRRNIGRQNSDADSAVGKGVVVLGAADFVQFETCMKSTKLPSETMVKAEQLHRQMRKR